MLNLTSIFTAVDGTPQVPFVSMLCMATTMVIALIAPIFLIRYAKKKFQGSLKTLLFGMVMYIVFDFIMLSVIVSAWKNIEAVGGNPVLMSILEALLTGVIGIVGRFVLMLAIAKSKIVADGNSIGNAIMAGVGYTIYRALLILIIIGQRFILALTINMFGIGNLTTDMEEGAELEGMAEIYEAFLTTPAYTFLIDGIKYLLVLVVSIALMVIVYAVYNKKAHRLLVAFSLLIMFLFEIPFCMNYYGVVFKNYFAVFFVAILFDIWLALLAYKTMNVSLKEEVKAKEAAIKNAKKQAFPDFNANIKK